MKEIFIHYWLEALFSVVLAFISIQTKILWKKIQRERIEQELMKEAMLSILHDRLFQVGHYLLVKKKVTVDELENLEFMYKRYTALGGNGICKTLYEKVLKYTIIVADKDAEGLRKGDIVE